MQFQSENTCDQSKRSTETQQLKKKITISVTEMHQLLSNSTKFAQRIIQLNTKGVKQINEESYEQALLYLNEAEKNLQYAANSGIDINLVLITMTLKNQACAYQRIWELGTCYDYMQALIYNLKNHQQKQLSLAKDQIHKMQEFDNKKMQKIMNNKFKLGLSYLQFSALSSQLGKHQQARNLVQKSLSMFSELTKYCFNYQKNKNNKVSFLLSLLIQNIEYQKKKNVLQMCCEAIRKIRNHKYFFSFDSRTIQKISMGDIMQLEPTSFQQAGKLLQPQWFISQLGLIHIIIYISCCFFALATQIRLSITKQRMSEAQIKEKMSESKTCHVHSIWLASQLILIDTCFLGHIIKSLKNNFAIDIQKQIQKASSLQLLRQNQYLSTQFNQNIQNKQQIKQQNENIKDKKKLSFHQQNENKDKQLKKQQKKDEYINKNTNLKTSRSSMLKAELNIKQNKKSTKQHKLTTSRDCKSKNKSKTRSKSNIKLKFNNQYFSHKSPATKIKLQGKQPAVKSKLTRKQEQSRSRPKLKLKQARSPVRL